MRFAKSIRQDVRLAKSKWCDLNKALLDSLVGALRRHRLSLAGGDLLLMNGRWYVTDKTVRLWDVNTGRKVRDLTGLRRAVVYIAFSPDGRLLATGDDQKNIRIWDPDSGEEIYKLSGHKKSVYAVAFSPDGRWLVSGSWDKTIKIWDVEAGREVHTLTGHEHPIYSVAFDSRGQWLASGSRGRHH